MKEKLNADFLYVHSLSEGIGSNDIGLDRGQLGDGVVVHFKKAGNKILLIQPNQNFRAITDNIEEIKSVKEAFAKSVLYGFIIKEEKNGMQSIVAENFIRTLHVTLLKSKRKCVFCYLIHISLYNFLN